MAREVADEHLDDDVRGVGHGDLVPERRRVLIGCRFSVDGEADHVNLGDRVFGVVTAVSVAPRRVVDGTSSAITGGLLSMLTRTVISAVLPARSVCRRRNALIGTFAGQNHGRRARGHAALGVVACERHRDVAVVPTVLVRCRRQRCI